MLSFRYGHRPVLSVGVDRPSFPILEVYRIERARIIAARSPRLDGEVQRITFLHGSHPLFYANFFFEFSHFFLYLFVSLFVDAKIRTNLLIDKFGKNEYSYFNIY